MRADPGDKPSIWNNMRALHKSPFCTALKARPDRLLTQGIGPHTGLHILDGGYGLDNLRDGKVLRSPTVPLLQRAQHAKICN